MHYDPGEMAVTAVLAMVLAPGIAARKLGGDRIRVHTLSGVPVGMPLAYDIDRAVEAQEEHRHDHCGADEEAHRVRMLAHQARGSANLCHRSGSRIR